MRDDARDGVALTGGPFGVVDELAALVDLVRDGVGAHRRLAAALERGRGRDHLGRGARLEFVLHREVGRLAYVGDGRRVVGGPLRHGQHVAGLGLDDHHRAVARLALGHLGGAGLLGVVLQRRDDGQPQVAAVHHLLVTAARERDLLAVRADLHLLAAGPAGQQRVVLLFEAGRAHQGALAVGAGETDEVGRDVTVGVGPGVARGQRDAGQVQCGDLVAGLRGYALGQHHVLRRGRVLDEVEDLIRRQAEVGGELGGDLGLIGHGDQRRVGVDQVRLHRHGEHLTVRARDAAAQRGQRDRPVPLQQGQDAVTAGLEPLQLDEARGEQRQHEDDREQGHAEPAARVAARDQTPGSGPRWPDVDGPRREEAGAGFFGPNGPDRVLPAFPRAALAGAARPGGRGDRGAGSPPCAGGAQGGPGGGVPPGGCRRPPGLAPPAPLTGCTRGR